MSIIDKIKSTPWLKAFLLRMMIPRNEYRPRLWVRLFLNPFRHKRGKHTLIRRSTRMDVFPFNYFELGTKSIIEDFATVNNGVGDVVIGERTIIGMSCVIIGPVKIGNDVMLAQNIVISGLNHGYENIHIPPSQQKEVCRQISIADAVWIGANSVITAGVSIGKHSVVGAGSVVTKSIPDFVVVAGNPAKIIKRYITETDKWEKV